MSIWGRNSHLSKVKHVLSNFLFSFFGVFFPKKRGWCLLEKALIKKEYGMLLWCCRTHSSVGLWSRYWLRHNTWNKNTPTTNRYVMFCCIPRSCVRACQRLKAGVLSDLAMFTQFIGFINAALHQLESRLVVVLDQCHKGSAQLILGGDGVQVLWPRPTNFIHHIN